MSSDKLTQETPNADRLDELISLVHRVAADVSEVKTRLNTLEPDVAAIKAQLNMLEQKVDERLYDTRPIWEAIQIQITELRNEVESNFQKFDRKLDVLHGDLIDMKDKQRKLEGRVDKLEEKSS